MNIDATGADAPLRLGVAGLGLAGAFMIRAARVHPRVRLGAAMDPLAEPRAAFARNFGAPVYDTFEALCADPNIEAIYIASPHAFHAGQAIQALHHGKHVLVEKPLALTLAECDAVIAAAARTDRQLIVGHTHAFDPNVRAMRDIIESGLVGAVGMILSFNYTDYLYRPHAPDEFDDAKGGGVTFNQVTHQVEVARLLAGAPVRSVRGHVGRLDPARPADGHCMASLHFANGVAASLTYSGYDGFDSDAFCDWVAEGGGPKQPGRHGTMRRLAAERVSDSAANQALAFGARALPDAQPHLPHFGALIVTCSGGDLRLSGNSVLLYGPDGVRDMPVGRGEGRPGQGDALDALWQAAREGKASLHDARWGRATVEIVLAIRLSAREGREVDLPI